MHENSAPNRFLINNGDGNGSQMALDAAGNLTIRGNFVSGSTTLSVPDYVFADDYDLRPLSEVAAFIAANSHLPDVPSAAQIAKDGLDMTDMQMRLLKKVEELTLYTLEQERRLDRQERGHSTATAQQAARIARLEAEIAELRER